MQSVNINYGLHRSIFNQHSHYYSPDQQATNKLVKISRSTESQLEIIIVCCFGDQRVSLSYASQKLKCCIQPLFVYGI